MANTERPMVLFIMGPTASGKTDLAIQLARRFPFDIISVDSAMVYRGMNIGTAKPDASTLRKVPHRLIDIRDPAEPYSAADFRTHALAEIAKILSIGRIPLLVGGTMLYFRALQRGLSDLPSANSEVRSRLEEERRAYGLEALYRRLQCLDPSAAARIHPNDPQRIQRALEIVELSGRSVTELYAEQKDETFPFRVFKLIVAPSDRQLLHKRIKNRFSAMLKQGFVQEVEALYKRPDLGLDKPSIRAVGYRQVWEYLDGLTDHSEMIEKSGVATRQLAKRQFTWLRSETDGIWFDTDTDTDTDTDIEGLFGRVCECLQQARFFSK